MGQELISAVVHWGGGSVNPTVRESQRLSEELFDDPEVISAPVPVSLDGARLDAAAAALFTQFSRSRLAEWVRAGRLTRNGQLARPRDKVVSGDELQVFPRQIIALTGRQSRYPSTFCSRMSM